MKLISGKSSSNPSAQSAKNKLQNHTTPNLVQIEIGSDVAQEDAAKIQEGIRIMDFYLNLWFGHSIKNTALFTVDASKKDSMFEERNGEMVAALHTNEHLWDLFRQFMTQYRMDMRSRFSAHEYVHFYQRDFGCGTIYKPEEVKLKWLMEGQAEWLSWNAMSAAGDISLFMPLPQLLTIQVKQAQTDLKPLSTYETDTTPGTNIVGKYSYFALAVELLMKNKDIKTLDDFCSKIAKGQETSVAFENAFGIPLAQFYSEFETYLQNLSLSVK